MNSAGAVAIIATSLIAIPRFVSIAAAVFVMAIATLMTMATHTTPPATTGATIATFTAFNPRSPQSILSDAGRESGVGEGKEFEMAYQPDIIIYHDHCADGFGAAWACWTKWADKPVYAPANYGQTPPDVAGKHVLIVDFSYKRDVLAWMAKYAASIIVLDHHKTAQADLADWSVDDVAGDFWADDAPLSHVHRNDEFIGQPIAALFDMEKSGAVLAWEFCHEEPVPMLLRLIQDRDLWRFTMPETKPFGLWLRSEELSFERFDSINYRLEMGNTEIMAEARAMQRFFDAKVEEIASFAKFRGVAEHNPIVVNCPPMFASEVGHALLDKHPTAPFSAMWYESGDKRMWSLRSRDDRQDVSEVAAIFGGGGHRNAAGFAERAL